MIFHGSTVPQTLDARWDPFDIDYVWFAWDEMLRSATITDSEWIVPSAWTIVAEQQAASVENEDGNAYTAANGVLLSTTATAGRHAISNRVTLSDGRQYERTITIVVSQI